MTAVLNLDGKTVDGVTNPPAIYRGDDYPPLSITISIEGVAQDISTWEFLAQLRKTPNAADVLATFDVDDTDAATGVIALTLDHTVTELLPIGTWSWDLQTTSTPFGVRTFVGGKAKVVVDVSREP